METKLASSRQNVTYELNPLLEWFAMEILESMSNIIIVGLGRKVTVYFGQPFQTLIVV